jgi:hypothetical protein
MYPKLLLSKEIIGRKNIEGPGGSCSTSIYINSVLKD